MKNDKQQMTNSSPTRRAVLRGSGALIALPFMESFGFQRFASASTAAATVPKRMAFLGMGYGITADRWYPDRETVGEDYIFPKILKPLAKHKKDVTFIQNLMHQYSADGHSGSTFWLTGANRFSVPGQSLSNSISADQVIAQQLGQDTRFSSIQLNSADGNASGHGPGLSLAWDARGKPVGGFNDQGMCRSVGDYLVCVL